MILTPLQKLPNNVGDLGKMIVAIGFEWLPKVEKIAQSGHTDPFPLFKGDVVKIGPTLNICLKNFFFVVIWQNFRCRFWDNQKKVGSSISGFH